jgi:hypothetical protein
VVRIGWATPDGLSLDLKPAAWRQRGSDVEIDVPKLSVWDLILIEWGEPLA